jgi:regulator of nonsense transcripts 2
MRHVLSKLTKENIDRVAFLLQKFPWEQEHDFLLNEFTVLIVSQAKFNDMGLIAVLLKNLKQHPDTRYFVTDLLDAIFEEIYRQMERNDFKESQRRIAVVKFIAEAYNYKVLHTDTIIEFLYRLINYDIINKCQDQYLASLDTNPIDSFRIRLVCTILDVLSQYFWKSERRMAMDRYLIFLQKYILSK